MSYYDDVEPLCVLSVGGGGYEWAEVSVFQNGNELRWGSGAGCSCNSFGDEYPTFDSLETLDDASWPSLVEAVEEMSDTYADRCAKTEFLAKVAKLMRTTVKQKRKNEPKPFALEEPAPPIIMTSGELTVTIKATDSLNLKPGEEVAVKVKIA